MLLLKKYLVCKFKIKTVSLKSFLTQNRLKNIVFEMTEAKKQEII